MFSVFKLGQHYLIAKHYKRWAFFCKSYTCS